MKEEGLTAVLTTRLTKILLSFCGFLFDGPVVIRVLTESERH